ncbi:uncharacterized protein LOC113240099 [Hyposmocoma kahamanoa]|uniref:uncharacterized protein LOC113240099 n=1 Tax=Hyposmocoma kahamanoa TaxID=1477025 RepID=UPI000E6D6DE3|nr:uncharacterized protein LOC113240099 [Hyposmocoma kahamanoa]
MAPPPEYDKEPKAPDKSVISISCEETKALHNLANDQQTNSDNKPEKTVGSSEVENNKHVGALDDGQLRALLDEAITYKCPKDREGKSNLFKELLQEVELRDEQDEQASEEAARGLSGGRRGRATQGRARRALPHSNSLQDLVAAALAAEPAPRHGRNRHHHNSSHHHSSHHHPPPVSARAIHGGSLPSGVDTSFLLGEEPTATRGSVSAGAGGYLATVRCVNPPPLAERRVSASDANCASEVELLNRRSKPAFPMTYTARATLEIGSGSVCSGRATTTTTASNQVDSAIPFSCITTPEVVASCNTTSSTSQSTVAVDHKPLQLASSYLAVASLTGPPPPAVAQPLPAAPRPVPAMPGPAPTDLHPRSVISSSFNGLPMPLTRPNYGSTASTASDEFKKSLDENGNSVQGFSSPLSGSSQHKKPRRKKSSKNETVITSHEINGYQGNKDLEELLRFIESNAEGGRAQKLPRAKHKDDAEDKGGKKRSAERRKDKESKMKRATSMEELSRTKLEDLTDKPKKERRADAPAKAERRSWGDDARDAFYFRDEDDAAPAPDADFQTVTKKRKPRRREPEPDAAAGDPPRPAPPPAPPKPHRKARDCESSLELHSPEPRQGARRRSLQERGPLDPLDPLDPPDCPAPDVVADRRPPVILLDSAARPRDMDGVTFGFDINEQLLGGAPRRPRCDLVRDAVEGGAGGVAVLAGCAALRYVPPAPPVDTLHLHQIIDYVGAAWEDVVRCGSGKVRYFSE